MTEQEIYKKAANKFGEMRQLLKLAEECNELSRAIIKYFDAINYGGIYTSFPQALDNLEEELADVEIMLEQMKTCFDWSDDKKFKLKRLENLIMEDK